MPSASSYPLFGRISFMKSYYFLALALLLLVITPVAADIANDEKNGKNIEVINDV